MKAQAYIYKEDGDLVIGIRSDKRFDGSQTDDRGRTYFRYEKMDAFEVHPLDVLSLVITPVSDGWEVHTKKGICKVGYVSRDEGSDSYQFDFEI